MNNTFIFTPANSSKTADVGAALNFNATSAPRGGTKKADQPFSNVLDRAVQTRPKPRSDEKREAKCDHRKEPLTAGRSETHRSERSVEAHAEHKAGEDQRTEKRKDAEPQAEVSTPIVCVGLPTTVAMIEVSPVSETSASTAEVAQAADSGEAVVGANPTTNVVPGSTTQSAPQNASSQSAVTDLGVAARAEISDAQADEELLAAIQNSGDASDDVDLQAAAKVIADASQALEADLQASASDIEVAVANALQGSGTEFSPLAAATAREVVRGVTLEPAAEVSGEESAASPPTDEAAVAAAVVTPEAVRPLRAARRDRGEDAENSGGIAAAKMEITMNNALKTEENAGSAGQNLPGGGSAMKNLPSDAPRIGAREISAVEILSATRPGVGPTRSDTSEIREASPSNTAASAARIGEIISREVRMFKRGGDDLVEVVLTPDTRTQISLKLQWRDGQVEVQARCDMGNYHSLNNDWPQLQAALAGHGVRLSHLSERVQTGFTEFFNNSGFSQNRGGERQETSRQSGGETLFTPVTSVVKTSTAKAIKSANQRLESWA